MCLAIPARVIDVRPNQKAVIDLAGVRKEISTALVDEVAVDDYVIVHVGYAIGKVDPDEAQRTLEMFNELQQAEAPQHPAKPAGIE